MRLALGMDPARPGAITVVSAAFSDAALVLPSGDSLLGRTMVLYGSNMGNASSHDTRNLPIVLAGGGFKHGQHLAFDQKHNVPLGNLFVSMLQRIGVETGRFGTGTSTLTGLELA